MRKVRKLSFFGILGIIIVALVFIGIIFTQVQLKALDKPPWAGPDKNGEEVTWAVELPVEGAAGTMLYGDGFTYINDDSEVRIKVEKGSSRVRVPGGGRETVFYYYFSFKLVNPTGRYAGFQNVVLIPEEDPEPPYCIFPDGICMESFLNQLHPHLDYEYFNLKFQVGQHSFTEGLVGYNIEGIEDMPLGIPVKFVGYSDWIKIRVQNQEDFLNPSTEFHNVECDERNYDDEIFDNMNIWIVRLETNKWRISVEGANLLLQEQYTQRAQGKAKKGGTKTVTVVPLEATGDFTFYIDFIKNLPTE